MVSIFNGGGVAVREIDDEPDTLKREMIGAGEVPSGGAFAKVGFSCIVSVCDCACGTPNNED